MNPRVLSILKFAVVVLVFIGSLGIWYFSPNQPQPTQEELFKGITYIREVHENPRPLVIHVIRVDLKEKGIRFLVTPGNPKQDLPLKAQTTSQFLKSHSLQVAINGDFFDPWYNQNLINYYPQTGDFVDSLGYAASEGLSYSEARTSASSTLYISKANKTNINFQKGKLYNAISGHPMLVRKGLVVNGLDQHLKDPRTAIGVTKNGRYLILVVVDGRQPGYSEGVTLHELAEILLRQDAYQSFNLDGGGSSTLVKKGLFGNSVLLNRPINQNFPGRERPVGNHLGIYAKP